MTLRIGRIMALGLNCPSPPELSEFYVRALGFQQFRSQTPSEEIELALGRERVLLRRTSDPVGRVAVANSTSFQHFAIVVSSMDEAMNALQGASGWVPISAAGPERLPASSGGVTAFKFRDPAGHPLELLAFPGAEPAHWKNRSGLFLGIDHTAITVANTGRSVAFYAALGFSVTGRSTNSGPEQSRLDDVSSAIVDVTSLAIPDCATPHLELLCYRSPPVRTDETASDDVSATRVLFESSSGDDATSAQMLLDPDGHRWQRIAAPRS